jgi:hypothetical protein
MTRPSARRGKASAVTDGASAVAAPARATEAQRQTVLGGLRTGLPYVAALDLARIPRRSGRDWRERGREEACTDAWLIQWAADVDAAVADGVHSVMASAVEGEVSPAWAQWRAEKAYPMELRPPAARSEVSGPDGGPLRVQSAHEAQVAALSDEQLAALLAKGGA